MAFSFAQLQQLLEQSGLDSASAAIGAAIALAESGGRPDAVGDDGTSFGLWQIHLPAHPDVSQACALDPSCAAAAAARISEFGHNWNPWTTFRTGAYQAFGQSAVQQAVQWAITLAFGQRGPGGEIERGVDVGIDVGTAIATPVSGIVQLEDRGKDAWGKRVLVKIDQGPLAGWTYAVGHLHSFAVATGQHVGAGQVIGTSGGDPSDPSSGESTGPHVELQFLDPLGAFRDPQQILGQLGVGIGQLLGGAGQGLPNPLQGAQDAIAGSIADAASRLGYLLLGIALIFFGLLLLVIGSIPWGRAARAVVATTPAGRAAEAAA